MDEQLVAAVEPEYDELEQPSGRVEPEAKLPTRTALVELSDVDRMFCRVEPVLGFDVVLQCSGVDIHLRGTDPGTHSSANRLRPTELVLFGSLRQSGKQRGIHPHRHHGAGCIRDRPSTPAPQALNGVAPLGLGGPGFDLRVCDGHAVDGFVAHKH